MKLRIEHTVYTWLRNKPIGSIGSWARNSTQTNADSSTAAAANSPMICTEPHAYSVPPHSRPRIRLDTPRATKPMPA